MHCANDDPRQSTRLITQYFFRPLPSRTGRSAALDAAIKCVAAGVRELCKARVSFLPIKLPVTDSILEMQELYATALTDLQLALADPHESLTVETATATQLLSCFEVRGNLFVTTFSSY